MFYFAYSVFFLKSTPNAQYSTWHKTEAQKYLLKKLINWVNLISENIISILPNYSVINVSGMWSQ